MKKLSKIVSLLSAISMLFSFSIVASASEVTLEDKINVLLSQGIPNEFLEGKEAEQIEEIYGKLSGKEIVFNGTEIVTMSETNTQSDVMPLGTIPSDHMLLKISTISNVKYDTNKKLDKIIEVYVYVDYEWYDARPFWTWKDAITVNWDSSVFTYKSNSFSAKDYKKSISSNGKWFVTDTYNNPAALSQGGLGYFANLAYSENLMGNTVGATGRKGSAYFTLLPRKSPMYLKSGVYTSAINVEYLHNKNPGLLSISFGYKGAGVTASVPGLKDSVAKSATYRYSY